MKAKNKITGEMIEVEPAGSCKSTVTLYRSKDGRDFPMYALEFEKDIDWEQRRYEIAKTVICAQITAPIIPGVDPNPSISDLAERSVLIADALIAELKKGGQHG